MVVGGWWIEGDGGGGRNAYISEAYIRKNG
jgi:hypothetical protein